MYQTCTKNARKTRFHIKDLIFAKTKCFQKNDNDPTAWTKDGDGAIQKALLEFYGGNIELLSDEHHVNKAFKKHVRKQEFSSQMLPAKTKRNRQIEVNNFAEDLASRCTIEIKYARETNKTKQKVIDALKNTDSAVLACIQGDHSKCDESSFVCDPVGENTWSFKFLQNKVKIEPTKTDIDVIAKHLKFRIGSQALEVLWKGTNTQNCEAFNRKMRKHLPKNINFTRNVKGRVFSTATFQNRGYKTATQLTHQRVGFVTSTKIQTKTTSHQRRLSYLKNYQKTQTAKNARFNVKFEKYQYHRTKNLKLNTDQTEEEIYEKQKNLFKK